MFQEINKELLVFLNSLSEIEIIKNIAIIFADAPIFFLPLFLAGFWLYYSYSKKTNVISEIHLTKNLLEKENLLFIFYSVVLGISISILIQQFIHLERPETALEGAGQLLLNHIPDASFPSDHATVAIAFLTSLFLAGYKKIAYTYMPFAILMLLSRIIAGVHWPFDILAGSLVGIFASFITFNYLIKLKFINKFNQLIIKIMSFLKI